MGEKRAYKARKPGGGRKKLKPEYDAGKNLKDQMDAAVALYEEDCSLQSIADVLNLNPIKVRKLLITAGVYESEVAEKVQDTVERYRKTQDYKTSILSTATVLGLSKASVTSYLPYSFDAVCQQLNREYQKNKNKNEIKSHHYIISFDPRDSTENCLTGKRAQELGLEYAKANFPGHQALVCTHMDGHNGSGNIHVHIVINSLRKLDVPLRPFMERPIDCKAGYKHHVTNEYLKHLQKSLMDLCRREFLHQVDLLFKMLDSFC